MHIRRATDSSPGIPAGTAGRPARPLRWRWLLGDNHRIRVRMPLTLVCALVYVAFCALAFVGEHVGLTRKGFAVPLAVGSACQMTLFIALLRSGWSLRLKDPGMMFPQNIVALISITYAYSMLAPTDRGMALMIVSLMVVFSIYVLSPGQSLALGVASALILAVPMLVMPHVDPQWFPFDQELVRFELLAGTLPALTMAARHIARWRENVGRQRDELKATLARVQDLATRDKLTGLCNRRHMQDLLEQAGAGSAGFCIALVDLDHFKQINDRHGHRTGDLALQGFANACVEVLRSSDVAARWGGEEFLIFFPDLSATQAHMALGRLREALAQRQVCPDAPDLRVAFSAGVAGHKPHNALDHTLERADRALYAAKHEGRDRSLLAGDTTLGAPLGVA
jgi:diguanylate cyclase (GGDEF)-like protein